MRFKSHPRNKKICLFCEYWSGDAQMKFVNPYEGYEYENTALGYCTKRGNRKIGVYGTCSEYEPSREAKKLL